MSYLPFLTSERYRVILKKVSFGIFRIILVSEERKKLQKKANTEGYLWARFHDIWSLSKSSKLDIWKAISAKKSWFAIHFYAKTNTKLRLYFIFLLGHLKRFRVIKNCYTSMIRRTILTYMQNIYNKLCYVF